MEKENTHAQLSASEGLDLVAEGLPPDWADDLERPIDYPPKPVCNWTGETGE